MALLRSRMADIKADTLLPRGAVSFNRGVVATGFAMAKRIATYSYSHTKVAFPVDKVNPLSTAVGGSTLVCDRGRSGLPLLLCKGGVG